LAAASPTPNGPKKNKFSWHSIKSVIAFGDSYTYVQGTLGRTNYTFIHDNFDISFTPQELLSNRILQNQTSTAEGGPNWVEHLTGCGVEPGLHEPRKCDIQLWDFAYGMYLSYHFRQNNHLTPYLRRCKHSEPTRLHTSPLEPHRVF
jgi:hypothetical protein